MQNYEAANIVRIPSVIVHNLSFPCPSHDHYLPLAISRNVIATVCTNPFIPIVPFIVA